MRISPSDPIGHVQNISAREPIKLAMTSRPCYATTLLAEESHWASDRLGQSGCQCNDCVNAIRQTFHQSETVERIHRWQIAQFQLLPSNASSPMLKMAVSLYRTVPFECSTRLQLESKLKLANWRNFDGKKKKVATVVPSDGHQEKANPKFQFVI